MTDSALGTRHSALEWVGPVLENSDTGRALVQAMREGAPGLRVEDRGAYLRVLVAGRCELQRAVAERVLGREFRLPGDLEAVMPSFQGRFTVTTDAALWSVRKAAA